MIREVMVFIALMLLLICANVIYQNIHCGTPVCRAAPLQIIPCDPADKLSAEMDDLKRRAMDNPAQ